MPQETSRLRPEGAANENQLLPRARRQFKHSDLTPRPRPEHHKKIDKLVHPSLGRLKHVPMITRRGPRHDGVQAKEVDGVNDDVRD